MSVASRRKERKAELKRPHAHNRKAPKQNRRRRPLIWLAVLVGAILILGFIYTQSNATTASNSSTSSSNGSSSKYPYQVGQPGVGATAPAINLTSTNGSTFDLSAYKGKSVLLFFQEGLSCQACWDQLKDIESNKSKFQALGIDTIVNITDDSLNALQQKEADEHYTSILVTDPNDTVSQSYHTTDYGMHENTNGHSFVLVGPDGKIRWRGDYGGAPNYTMYVPIDTLIADIKSNK